MIDRSPGARSPAAHRRRRRGRRREPRPRAGSPAVGVRRRPRRHRFRRRATPGICVDLRGMKRIDVDPDARDGPRRGRAHVGELDAATQEHGLAVTGGRVSDTGVAGLALGQRQRLARAQARLHLRQPARGRGRHRRRAPGHRLRRTRTPTCSGASGRRRQLRCRHRLPLPAAPDRADRARRHAHVPGRDGRRPHSLLARLHARRPRRGRQRHGVHHRARPRSSCPSRCGASPSSASIVCYAGDPDEGEEVLRPLREFGPPGDRHDRPDPLRRRCSS